MPQTRSSWILPADVVEIAEIFPWAGESSTNLDVENPGTHVHLTLLNRVFPDPTQNGLYISYRFYPLFPGSTPSVLEGAFKVHSVRYMHAIEVSAAGEDLEYYIIGFKLAENPTLIKNLVFASSTDESTESLTYMVLLTSSDSSAITRFKLDEDVFEHIKEIMRTAAPPGVMPPPLTTPAFVAASAAPAPAPAPPLPPLEPPANDSVYSQNLAPRSRPSNSRGGSRRTRQRKNRSRKNKRHSRRH